MLLVVVAMVSAGFAAAEPAGAAVEGPGGPILVVSSAAHPFSEYYVEILRNEGLNAFDAVDITSVTPATLAAHDVVVLGEIPIDASQAAMLAAWVADGGNLIAMRPDPDLASLVGVTDTGTDLADEYLQIDTAAGTPGAGLVGQTIQFHGTADRYDLDAGTDALATLWSTASTATTNPAVTLRSVGSNGGQVAAFAYDLARSVVYTRQGNPAWAGQERDGEQPPIIRSDDLFFPDWIDLDKVQIPQADEQQRLLANLIEHVNRDVMPLPRFWYFPRGERAVVVMTGDDHASSDGTAGQFDWAIGASPPGCVVDEWECVRGTSYVYPSTPLSDAAAAAYEAQGFEVAAPRLDELRRLDARASPGGLLRRPAVGVRRRHSPSVAPPATNRTHCITWSDWATHPKTELAEGIRLDTNYYYWPASWVNNRPGYFTGSGLPMRFADLDGSLIDVYQAATQMTDESGIGYAHHITTLLDNALGAPGYYGAITANMHTDNGDHPGQQTIVNAALARGVPVVSARQMLTWLDGRNGSSFEDLAWNGDRAHVLDRRRSRCEWPPGAAPDRRARGHAREPDPRRQPRRVPDPDDQGDRVRRLHGRGRHLQRHLRRRRRRAGDHRRAGGSRGSRRGDGHLDDRRARDLAGRLRHLGRRPQQLGGGPEPHDRPRVAPHRPRPRHDLLLPGLLHRRRSATRPWSRRRRRRATSRRRTASPPTRRSPTSARV